jgi:serine/threonine protein kinase
MLREENSAFSEEEVGGAWAQPHPLPPPPPPPPAFSHSASSSFSSASAMLTKHGSSDLKPTTLVTPAQKGQKREVTAATMSSTLDYPGSVTQSVEDGRESAFALAVTGATADAATTAPPAPPSSPREPVVAQLTQAGGLLGGSASFRNAAALREAAMDEELLDNDDNAVMVRQISSSHNSRSCNSRSCGPPVAAVMTDATVREVAPTTTNTTVLMRALDAGDNAEANDDEAPFPHGLERPAPQASISFSFRSSSSSSSSSSLSTSDNAAEAVHDQSAAAAAGSVFAAAGASSAQCDDCGSLLPCTRKNDIESANHGLSYASESLHSSPVAVTLWGVHRDLRRKRIKKVSHYILGSLLGEGAYGVVRDCIDINTDNVNRRFQRCAIKILNGAYAKADMPAIFGHRTNGKDAGGSSLSTDLATASAAAAASPVLGGLKRTTGGGGMRYHREEEQRRHETLQREMRNLQRFHSKHIIRALDSFTRYSKEYVVLPIAICSVQQLVRQLMRTRWREAVREWRRRQRRQQRRAAATTATSTPAATTAATAGNVNGGEGTQKALPPLRPGLPMVPSTVDTLDLDDLTFMMEDDSDMDDDDDDDDDITTEGNSDAEHAADDTAARAQENCKPVSSSAPHRAKETALGDTDDAPHSSGSLSDRDDDEGDSNSYHRYRNSNNDNNNSRQDAIGDRRGPQRVSRRAADRRRGLPRVSSTGSNTTTTTTTTRTIDSYDNDNNGNNNSSGGFTRGHQRGGEDATSDGSSCGVSNGNGNIVHVMSATPTTQDGELVLGGHPAAPSTLVEDASVAAQKAGGADTAATIIPAIEITKNSTAASPTYTSVDNSRPHLTFPMCSTTLLKGIFYQVISGVNYLHQQNLAHNDIKPSNILLFEDGTVKLGDLGSVSETYNDQGTPLCASPELCKYFYGAATPPSSFSQSTEAVGRDAAKPSDMWCCGLLLYYLITGKPGPLPVQLRYFQSLHSKQHQQRHLCHKNSSNSNSNNSGDGKTRSDAASRGAVFPQIITRYQLYREVAAQTSPVDLSGLPDMIPPDLGEEAAAALVAEDDGESGTIGGASQTWPYPKNSVRHLLAGLLELDPQRRLTAEQALRHPWLRMTFRVKPNNKDDAHQHHRYNNNNSSSKRDSISGSSAPRGAADESRGCPSPSSLQQQQRKAPSKQAMEDAIQRDVARRVTQSRHVQRMLLLDRQRHLQFVADCCNMLNLSIPPEIIKVQPAEPYREDITVAGRGSGTPPASRSGASTSTSRQQQQRKAAAAAMAAAMLRGGGRSNNNGEAATGTVLQSAMLPDVMPPGCVDTELFLPHSEEDYYEQKSGKSEFDVRVLRRKPLLMAQLDEYFHNVVLVQCGYRTGPDPSYQAMRVRAVPLEDEMGSNGSGSGSRRRGITQQPSVVILPGASSNVYRRCPSAGVTQIAAIEGSGAAAIAAGTAVADGDPDVVVDDVWGAGPRHQPRVRVDENGNVVTASSHPHNYSGGTPTSATAAVTVGRVVGGGAGTPPQPSSANSTNIRSNGVPGSVMSASGSRSASRNATSFPVQGTTAATGTNTNRSTRSSTADRPAASTPANGGNSGSVNNNHNNRYSTVDSASTQEVVGTPVVSTARASAIHDNGRSSGGNNNSSSSTRHQHHGNGRSPRDGSESASEGEQNVAMRESSKCLCGLM